VTTLEHPPHSAGLAVADFHLFPQLKSEMKGRRSCDTADIIKNAMEELKRLSQNGFQECSIYLYSRWQKCVISKGNYFERNVAS
jgi:histone-lysine N-methyltransferase SETMAR